MIPFPDKKYQIIYADPPWEVMRGPDYNSNGPSKPLPYPTMSIEEIVALPVYLLADKKCHLYLWTINKYVKESYDVAKSWGLMFLVCLRGANLNMESVLVVLFVQTTEHLLFCRKGTLTAQKRIDTTWFEHKRLSHSEKPKMFRDLIVEVSGDLPRIELFARQETPGWDVWGNEVNIPQRPRLI